MKLPELLIVGVLAHAVVFETSGAEERTFTDTQGRTIVASLVSATDTDVTIKRADGREFTLSLEKLTDADSEFIAQWRSENPDAAAPVPASQTGDSAPSTAPPVGKLDLTYRVDKKKTGSRKMGKDKSEEKWGYEISVSNRSRTALPDLTVKYELFIRYYSKHTDPKRGLARTQPGELALKGLAAQGNATFKTASAATLTDKSRELNGDIVTSTHYIEDLEGVILKFFQGEKEVGEYSYGKTRRD